MMFLYLLKNWINFQIINHQSPKNLLSFSESNQYNIILLSLILISIFIIISLLYILRKKINLANENEQHYKITLKTFQDREKFYHKIVDYQTDFILHSLSDTTITFANLSLCQALGVTLDQMIGKKWSDFANQDDLEKDVIQSIKKLTPEHPTFIAENRDRRKNGEIGWTQWLNQGIFNENRELIEIQSVGRDITQLKLVEHALRENEERLRLVTENMQDLVCLLEKNGKFIYVTPSCESLLGYQPDDLIGQSLAHFLYECERPQILQQISSISALNHSLPPLVYRMQKKTGDYIWLETLIQPILNQEGVIVHLQSTSRDVSDRIKMEQQLKYDALHDSLTGLKNRTFLMNRLDEVLKENQFTTEPSLAILFLDLDHFKLINDTLGHLIGDQLLKLIANKLLECVRQNDLVARLGGDEFVILLEKINRADEVIYIASRILNTLATSFMLNQREIFVTTSIGIVIENKTYYKAEDLIRDADLALYQAKSKGRGCYAIFESEMYQSVLQRVNLENDLRKAIFNQELMLYYQPIITLETLKLVGFEALIRWNHPTQGLISPAQFIPLAEESGLIIFLGQWVLEEACQQLQKWQGKYSLAQTLKISINLSVQQLQDSQLLEKLQQVIQKTKIDGSSLILEITESMLVKNIQKTDELLSRIQSQGILISIDDFGTGYSSLSYLHRLPVNAFKIDRSFINQIQKEDETYTIVETIITLSKLLGLKVVAEGVETLQQLNWLRYHQCDFGQGFLFSKPVPSEQAEYLLTQNDFSSLA